uniref:Uncharacterized protein n=1 Tax=Anguilla anguilla TaxID=7936 RepID=A0A0E9SQ52_ANGAN
MGNDCWATLLTGAVKHQTRTDKDRNLESNAFQNVYRPTLSHFFLQTVGNRLLLKYIGLYK